MAYSYSNYNTPFPSRRSSYIPMSVPEYEEYPTEFEQMQYPTFQQAQQWYPNAQQAPQWYPSSAPTGVNPWAVGASSAAGELLAGPVGAALGPLVYNLARGQTPLTNPNASWLPIAGESLAGGVAAGLFPGAGLIAAPVGAGGAAYFTQPRYTYPRSPTYRPPSGSPGRRSSAPMLR